MFKVLIVDDEPIILDGLKYVINWQEHGLEICATAQNGQEALDILRNQRVDILVTDIRMPKIDGLELIRQIKQHDIKVKIIILSGYSEFEYAKEAAKLGIENYILKPIDEDELSSSLLSIIEKLEAEQTTAIEYRKDFQIIRENILYRWVIGTISREELSQRFEMFSLKLDYDFYLVSSLRINPTHTNNSLHMYQTCQTSKILKASRTSQILHSQNNISQDSLLSDISLMQFALSNVCEEIVSNDCQCQVFNSITGDTIIIFYWNNNDFSYQKAIEKLLLCMEAIKKYLKFNVTTYVGSIETDCMNVYKSFSNITELVSKNKLSIDNNLVEFQTYYSDKMLKSSSQIQVNTQVQAQAPEYSPLVNRVINHIETWYYKELSLKSIASAFKVNAAYLGRIFKTETGEMFNDYLNNVRIEKAKNLLLQTDYKANYIAKKVGYTSPNYFYYIFKKQTGDSPSDYKRKVLPQR